MVRKGRKTCHILCTLYCLIRERLYVQCYVLNILSPEFPFLTVWPHLVIICILLKESVEHYPFGDITSSVLPVVLWERWDQACWGRGSRNQAFLLGMWLRRGPWFRNGLPSPLWGSRAWETIGEAAPLFHCIPCFWATPEVQATFLWEFCSLSFSPSQSL